MNPWLDEARHRLAASVSAPPADYDLTSQDVDLLLELARVAAHTSGDRTQAPLAAYLVGLAHARNQDRALSDVVASFTGDRAPAP